MSSFRDALRAARQVLNGMKNQPYGWPCLGEDGKIPTAQLPNMGGGGPHTHPISDVVNLQTTLNGKAGSTHAHAIGDVTSLQAELDAKCAGNDSRLSDARTPTAHGHTIADVSTLQTSLDGKAASAHTHTIANVTSLQAALDGKCATDDSRLSDARTPLTHSHAQGDVTGLTAALAGKEPANANLQAHVVSAHAPADAQKNSDITKAEIEAKLTGVISSHSHAGGGPVSAPFTGSQAPGSFTIADGQFGLHGKRLTLTGVQRATVEGSGRLTICG
jgi:hypothetical protein